MEATIFLKDGKVKCFKGVGSITWSKKVLYLDIMQTWNECGACDVECLDLKDIAEIKLKEREE